MATNSARMSQHKRQGPNPRGFEGFTDSPDGREAAAGVGRGAFWLGGGRAESSNNILLGGSRLQKTRLEDPKIETLKHKVETSEASRPIGFLKVLVCWKIFCCLLVDSKGVSSQPGCPTGRRIPNQRGGGSGWWGSGWPGGARKKVFRQERRVCRGMWIYRRLAR